MKKNIIRCTEKLKSVQSDKECNEEVVELCRHFLDSTTELTDSGAINSQEIQLLRGIATALRQLIE